MREVSFVHTADLHLDSPFIGLRALPNSIVKRLRDSTFVAFSRIVDYAILHKVDFVVISGDLYDGEDRSIRSQVRLRDELQRLNDQCISVYIIHGNHDHLNGKWTHIEMPSNVFIFSEKVEGKLFQKNDGTKVHLYGFSFPERHVFDRKINDYHKMEGADFHIGLLHGGMEGDTEHGKYAPFLLSELLEKGYDYWALGHIHKKQVLHEEPPVIYPGNIQGRHKNEQGAKGFFHVNLTENLHDYHFIETSDIVWHEQQLSIAHASFNDVLTHVQTIKEEYRKDGQGILLALTMITEHDAEWHETVNNGEFLEIINEYENEEESFVWIYDCKVQEVNMRAHTDLVDSPFFQEFITISNGFSDVAKTLSSLYESPQARRYISSLTEKENEELLQQSVELLTRLLKTTT